MKLADWNLYALPPGSSVKDVLQKLDQLSGKPCLIANDAGYCLAVFTQGDLRRILLSETNMDEQISKFFKPFNSVSVRDNATSVRRRMKETGVDFLPALNETGILGGIWMLEDSRRPAFRDTPVLILAGGRGERLRPLTNKIPKPLVEVGGLTLLDRNVMQCRDFGFHNFFISVNYLKEEIFEHVRKVGHRGCRISFLEEELPLGTVGPVGLLAQHQDSDVLVINSDVLHQIHLGDFAEQHITQNADVTVAVRLHEQAVPFGVLSVEGNQIKGVTEKPTLSFPVSMGLYMLGPSARQLVKAGNRLDMPDLINIALENGLKVEAFFAEEYWLDVGTYENLAIAERDFGEEIELESDRT